MHWLMVKPSLAGQQTAAGIALALTLACSHTPSAGFWFQRDDLRLPGVVADRIGGPLTRDELLSIQQLARAEVERAFEGLAITVTSDEGSFWRVVVVETLPASRNSQTPRAGESLAMGFLGGSGAVGFDFVAAQAASFAGPDETRPSIVAAIGRGVGRVAVHEFMHQMLGTSIGHNDADPDSYEHGRPDRRSQYYGELRWTTARPLLEQRFGVRRTLNLEP